ncbi:MAG: hypothetical protein HPY75_08505 [Actinobacteria bacterium]|nr:hypothetical protein [Actinomycetota bacterium]
MRGLAGRMTALILLLLVFSLMSFPAFSLAGGSGSVSVSAVVGPCISVTSGGEVRSNISVAAFADADFLTVLAR